MDRLFCLGVFRLENLRGDFSKTESCFDIVLFMLPVMSHLNNLFSGGVFRLKYE